MSLGLVELIAAIRALPGEWGVFGGAGLLVAEAKSYQETSEVDGSRRRMRPRRSMGSKPCSNSSAP